jgi:hypothetical protein
MVQLALLSPLTALAACVYFSRARGETARRAAAGHFGHLLQLETGMSAVFHFRARGLIVLVLLLAALPGCAQWVKTSLNEVNRLPSPALPRDSVVLEIAFAKLPLSDAAAYDDVWQQTDEQAFSTDVRREWAANGLRCGILGSQIPAKLREILDRKSSSLEEQSQDALDAQSANSRGDRRIQCRNGRPAKVYTSKTFDSVAVLTQESGTVRGWQLSEAQCLFGMKVYPLGDARAEIDLVPEIEHGPLKTQFVGRDGTVMPQLARERLVLDRLKLDATLAPGHVLMISTTPEAKGIGQQFFVEQTATAQVRLLLLIRLAVTQHDDLFAPDRAAPPLATPME